MLSLVKQLLQLEKQHYDSKLRRLLCVQVRKASRLFLTLLWQQTRLEFALILHDENSATMQPQRGLRLAKAKLNSGLGGSVAKRFSALTQAVTSWICFGMSPVQILGHTLYIANCSASCQLEFLPCYVHLQYLFALHHRHDWKISALPQKTTCSSIIFEIISWVTNYSLILARNFSANL